MFIISMCILFSLTLLLSVKKKELCMENDILNKNYTTLIRGIAIFMIMISHLFLFVYFYQNFQQHYYEKVIMFFICTFTNIAVGIFLFLSGYGNWLSINKHENKNAWIINKIVKFYVPVGILIVLSCILANILHLQTLFPHWWTPIRNFCTLSVVMWSFWYLKVQAMSYVFLFIVIKYFKKNILLILTSLFILYLIICLCHSAEPRWWFTALCFPFGCVVAHYKNFLYDKSNKIPVWVDLLIISTLIFMFFLLKNNFIMIFISFLACVIMTKLSNNLNLKSKLLNFMGKYSLELYLIHLTLIPILRNPCGESIPRGGSYMYIIPITVIESDTTRNK